MATTSFGSLLLLLQLLVLLTAPLCVLAQDEQGDDAPHWDTFQLLLGARVACAEIQPQWPNDFALCVQDVVRMHDVGVAGMWPAADPASLTDHEWGLRMARQSCAGVQEQPHRQGVVHPAIVVYVDTNHMNDNEQQQDEHSVPQYPDFDACVQQMLETGNIGWTKAHWLKTEVQRNLRGNASSTTTTT